jgi:regulator of protease activity HflC (stomatin/prohibitin superfamily)
MRPFVLDDPSPTNLPTGAAPPVSLAAVDAVVHWKIDPQRLVDYATRAERPDQRLRQLASAVLTREMLQHDADAAIGVERPQIARRIESRLREVIAAEGLGIEIVWVGLANVHPPQNVAEDFNAVAAAQQFAQNMREQGLQEQTRILTEAAGSVIAAEQIVREHQKLEQLRQEYLRTRGQAQAGEATEAQVQEAETALSAQQTELERLVQSAGGIAGNELVQARRDRWRQENQAIAQSVLDPVEFSAFQQAPRYYAFRRYLQILAQTMPDKRKFMLLTDDKSPDIQLNLEETIDALSALQIAPRSGPQRD